MNKYFLTYEQSLAVKELGFDEPCLGWFLIDTKELILEKCHLQSSGICLAPLKSQFFNWVRDNFGYHVQIRRLYFGVFTNDSEVEYNYFIYPKYSNEHLEHNLLDEYTTYEYAENACINDIINLLKEK